jgi:hypothetical protein
MEDNTNIVQDPFASVLGIVPQAPLPVHTEQGGSYRSFATRLTPACILFVCDQSASMDESFAGAGNKAQALADTVNHAINQLLTRCTRSEGVRPYFDIGVIGYGGIEANNALSDLLGADLLHSVTEFESKVRRIEERSEKKTDATGAIVEQKIHAPIWLEPRMSGGTPMCAALRKARDVVAQWCAAHPNSFPPVVIHVTDGQSTDGQADTIAANLRALSTNDGNVLLFNLHIASSSHGKIMFAADESQLADSNAKTLFNMSSLIPEAILSNVAERAPNVTIGCRFFGYNADRRALADFIQMGTQTSQTQNL